MGSPISRDNLRTATLVAKALGQAVTGRPQALNRLKAANTLFDEDRIVGNFVNMKGAFNTLPLATAETPSPLLHGATIALPDELSAWIESRSVCSMVILKHGKIVHEAYYRNTGPDDLRISWSMAKSVLSTLFGIVFHEGAIASLDEPVTRYAPKLIGSAYDGATIRNVLNMASGVKFNEDYMDPKSDINRMGRVIALGGSLDDFCASMTARRGEPGADWLYCSMDTHVIGMVIRGATGRGIVDLMNEKIMGPLGLEAAPYYIADGVGEPFVLGGLNLRTRDYARFGQMIAQRGEWQGRQIVPADWVDLSTTGTAPTAPGENPYGFQWWLPPAPKPGEHYAIGIYGQYIFIDREAGVVIALNSANRQFKEDGVEDENIAVLRRLVAHLAAEAAA